jgi:hypothetical protein
VEARLLDPCTVDGCLNTAARNGLCHAHDKRRLLGQEFGPPVKTRARDPDSAWRAAHEAALRLADADAEDDRSYNCAVLRARHAWERWVLLLWRSRGWRVGSERRIHAVARLGRNQ